MSVLQWLLDQLQRGYAYLIGLTDEVIANVIAAGIVMLVGAVWAWVMVRVFGRKRKGKEAETFDEAFLRRQRKAMLDVVERQWIEGRLERSLHQAPIILGLTETPEAVDRPWEVEIQTPGQAPRRTRDTSDIRHVFDACGSLLILGAPGSGKTVTLLDLARKLIQRARDDEDAPLPVVFMLASWAREKKPLDEWMVAEMKRSPYQVPPGLGRHWIRRHDVLPLLDGLDEVEESARTACVEAINAYRATVVGGAAVIVCSRETEYTQLSAHLKVETAVALRPLSEQQVKQHLQHHGKRTAMLARMLAANEQLSELARTPLWLDVMTVAYGDVDTMTAPKETTTGDIFDAYVRRVLFGHRQPLQEWSPKRCMRWLRWLAQQLERTEETLFRLEEMQPDWLEHKVEQRRYRLCLGWGTGTIAGLCFGILMGLADGVAIGFFVGLVCTLIVSLVNLQYGAPSEGAEGPFIVAVTELRWDWRKALQGLRFGLLLGGSSIAIAIVGLISKLIGGMGSWPTTALAMGLSVGLYFVLSFGLALGMQPVREIGHATQPNYAMWQSARRALIFGIPGGLVSFLTFGLLYGSPSGLLRAILPAITGGLVAWLLIGLGSPAGEAVLRHWVLRWRLWRERLTPKPWRYVAYLDAMTSHLLLDKIGGAYRFKHDLLQKHIAQLDDGFISSLVSNIESQRTK